MIDHCNLKFRPEEIWFLRNVGLFVDRRIEIGICPVCENKIVRFVEQRISDGKVFDENLRRRKAERCLKEHENEILYKSSDSFQGGRKCLYGFRYGEGTEKVNKKTGETTVIQKACDWYGNKEVVRQFNKD